VRTATKILVPLGTFKARDQRDLYEEVRRINWGQYLDVNGSLAVDAILKSDYFNHSQFVAQKTKDAIVDQFRDKHGRRPDVDLNEPDLRLTVHVNKDDCRILLDSSGESLHKRGYREEMSVAPLNESLAAGLVLLSGWKGTGNFIDPMCGSGTILIEAARIAANIPANIQRKKFGFQLWKDYDPELWRSVVEEAKSKIIKPDAYFTGSDSVFKVLELARANVSRAGLDEFITLSNMRFEESTPPAGGGIGMMNPPYGERLQPDDLNAMYKMIGDKLKKDYKGYDVWIISAAKDALKKVGLQASKRMQLYNGPLECKFHCYSIYEGTRDPKKLAAAGQP
jgi:putative N6-adenine-specific DNA methylase